MRLENKEIVRQKPEEVYRKVKDEPPDLVPYIPFIYKIEQLSREGRSDSKTKVVNHWYADVDVPKMLKAIYRPELLQWKDHAVWDDEKMRADFELECVYDPKLYELTGSLTFNASGEDKTELHLSVDLSINYDRLPGVPKFLARRIKNTIDDLVRNKVPPNLNLLAIALNKYFEANP